MTTILTAICGGGIVAQNPDGDAVTGRWCRPPEVPDRCYTCFDPVTLAYKPATGYVERDGWRYGTCPDCEVRHEATR